MPKPTLKNRALNLLARREHSRYELQQKLLKHCQQQETINQLLDDLSDEGLLSETRFTEAYIRYRSNRGYGPNRITQELQQRKIPEYLTNEMMDEEINWEAIARDVRIKKFGHELPTDYPSLAKQKQFLKYRGFTPEQIQWAMDEAPLIN